MTVDARVNGNSSDVSLQAAEASCSTHDLPRARILAAPTFSYHVYVQRFVGHTMISGERIHTRVCLADNTALVDGIWRELAVNKVPNLKVVIHEDSVHL